jgi:DNA-binding NtrC family response regulator
MSAERVRLLAVDDDPEFLDDLAELLCDEYSLERAACGKEALERVRAESFDAVLLDLDLGTGSDGLEILAGIRRLEPALPVFIVTKDASSASAVAALKGGATDYIDKTPNLADLERRIAKALADQRGRLAAENRFLRRAIDALKGEMVGESAAVRSLREAIRAAATSRRPVLIVGETGTGKELVARALHQAACPNGLFVPLNCAAVPRELFEAELFGSERGAYTGAERRLSGAFEMAAGGLLFLDEITEIGAPLQAALLRVIEQREFRPLGSCKTLEFTGRVVASTNRDLQSSLADGRLRPDLYYRFSANVLAVPPLRERRDDIPILARYFLERAATELKLPRPELSAEDLIHLCAHDWPGNVRELEHVVESLVSTGRLALGAVTRPCDSEPAPADLLRLPYQEAKTLVVRRFQRDYVTAVLAAHGGSVAAAAQQMGLSRFGLEKVIRQLQEPAESRHD